jgi:ATP-dependent Zn protease
MTEEAATAYHEAGHAVVANALGITTFRATIKPTKNTSGRVHHMPLSDTQKIIVGLAGPIAEYRYKGEPHKSFPSYIGKMKRDSVASKFIKNKSDELVYFCADIAWALVHSNWAQIELLACALLKYKTLGPERLAEFFWGDNVTL